MLAVPPKACNAARTGKRSASELGMPSLVVPPALLVMPIPSNPMLPCQRAYIGVCRVPHQATAGAARCFSQEPVAGVVLEQLGIADVAGEDLHGLVAADLLHLEHGSAASGGGGEEPRAERVPGEVLRVVAPAGPRRGRTWGRASPRRRRRTGGTGSRPPPRPAPAMPRAAPSAAAGVLRGWRPLRRRPPGPSWNGGW